MTKIKRFRIILILIIVSILGGYLYISREIQSKEVSTQVTQLTKQQKLEDFEYLYNVIKDNYPYIKLKERIFGYNWLDKKDEFERAIKKTNSDEEFFSEISKIVNLLQNGHTGILSPSAYQMFYSILEPYVGKNNNAEALTDVLMNEKVVDSYAQWERIIKDEYYCVPINFTFVEGKYVVIKDTKFNELDKFEIEEGAVLEEINNVPVDEYVKKLLDKQILKYDYNRKLNKINELLISTDKEELVKLKLTNLDGKLIEKSISSVKQKREYEDPLADKDKNLITNIIEKDLVAYLRINSLLSNFMEEDDAKILSFLEKVKDYPYLIIDVRGNGGGAENYYYNLVGHLIDSDIRINRLLAFRGGQVVNDYLKANGNNLSQYTDISKLNNNSNYPQELKTDFKFYIEGYTEVQPNNSVGFKGKIYLLVDDNVFSSCEGFAVFSKASAWATLVGTTTGGDGVGISPVFVNLPNSSLILRFSCEMGLNPDGTANEETHTPPDVYSEQNYKDFLKFLQWRKDNGQIISKPYDTMNPYDTVLNKTLELIKQNK